MPAKNKSGEKLIESILTSHHIRYDRKKKMKLAKDTKQFRIPDFYLQDYDLVIEFFGSWLVPENKKFEERERKRFMEKVGAYHQSGVHTLYLYPTQLKDAERLILKATKQISNLPVEYRQALYWNIPWMKEKKIEKPLESDFKKNKTEEVVKTIKTETKIVEEVKTITEQPREHKVIVGDFSQNRNDFSERKVVNNTFANILLFITGLTIFLFIVHGVTVLANIIDLINPAFELFLFVTIILIVLSAIYAIQRNILHGFIIVGIILTILILIGILILGNNVWNIVLTIIIILAVVPTEYYMINANKDK